MSRNLKEVREGAVQIWGWGTVGQPMGTASAKALEPEHTGDALNELEADEA